MRYEDIKQLEERKKEFEALPRLEQIKICAYFIFLALVSILAGFKLADWIIHCEWFIRLIQN